MIRVFRVNSRLIFSYLRDQRKSAADWFDRCTNPRLTKAEFNQEFLEDLHQLELDDWGRYGKVRQRWEKEIRDPDDVLLQAEERKKQLAKQRKKR
jgi:hypothetical protein